MKCERVVSGGVSGLLGLPVAAVPAKTSTLALSNVGASVAPGVAPGVAAAAPFCVGCAVGVLATYIAVSVLNSRKIHEVSDESCGKHVRVPSACDTAHLRKDDILFRMFEKPSNVCADEAPSRSRSACTAQSEASSGIPSSEHSFLDSADAWVSPDTDYAQVAETHVRKESFARRMAARAKGVAFVLAERVKGEAMEGIPVIQRADGSVGDIGTSWWDATVQATCKSDAVSMARLDNKVVSERIVNPDLAAAARVSRERAHTINCRVAEIDEVSFGESCIRDDFSTEAWNQALFQMDARAAENLTLTQTFNVFSDVIGGFDSLDEPDGLESATSVMHFRMPAGHPEVVDTGAYINYLIKDEFSHNPSTVARVNARSFLRVIEGGTLPRHATPADVPGVFQHSVAGSEYRGAHFAAASACLHRSHEVRMQSGSSAQSRASIFDDTMFEELLAQEA